MIDILLLLSNSSFIISALAAIAVFATLCTLILPLLHSDRLVARLDEVAAYREKLKQNQKDELDIAHRLRQKPPSVLEDFVKNLELEKHLTTDNTRKTLSQAGFYGERPYIFYIAFKAILPFVAFILAIFYFFVVGVLDQPNEIKFLLAVGIGFLGFFAPNIYLTNIIQKRREAIERVFPDSLDLLLICIESGMSIEMAFNRVSQEVSSQSIELAEELGLTTAELSYLQDRKVAYENLGNRTGSPGVKAVALSLIQAERYGTRVGIALRVMAKENRDLRIQDVEKKAAALPAKLTVPMIVFFLPALFVVILGPAVIQIMQTF